MPTPTAVVEMTYSLPPTPKGKATREKLLEAGEVVFGLHGYEQTRIADIVAKAGISHGLFYRHFADKDAILNAVLDRLNERLRYISGREEGDSLVPTLDQLQKRNIKFFQEYAEHRQLLLVLREAAARRGNSDKWLENRARFVGRTHRWLQDLAAKGHITEIPDSLAVADGLGALTEQMVYVLVGLPEIVPDEAELQRLGRACGLIWYRTVFGRES